MRDKSVLRADDERMSGKVSDLLDRVYYGPRYPDFERVLDRERQVKGMDVLFTRDSFKFICDEKAAVRWRNLKTFSFELSFIDRRGEVVPGWFVSDRCVNNSYFLIWLDQAEDGKETLEAALVRKEKIVEYLEKLGWGKDELLAKARQIREQDGEGINFGNMLRNGCKFSFSPKLVEEPINILLSRDVLKSLADDVFSCNVED